MGSAHRLKLPWTRSLRGRRWRGWARTSFHPISRTPRNEDMSPNRNLLLLAWSLAGVVVPAAGAHEFWIAPSRYDATRGAPVTLGAVAGTGFRGERKPWSPDHAVRWT